MGIFLGEDPLVLLIMVGIFGGAAAWMSGRAVAENWRPVWQAIASGFLLALATRFLTYGLFDGELLSFIGYLRDGILLAVIAIIAWRMRLAAKMADQYPWLYQSSGLFSWKTRQ
jgi:branched-chain amino acid transport system ATP-binding protein